MTDRRLAARERAGSIAALALRKRIAAMLGKALPFGWRCGMTPHPATIDSECNVIFER
jgi:hypothetical protein